MPKVHAADHGSSVRGRGRRVSTSLAEINVVPLVDVMLVLLVIFMVTAPMMQRGIDVKLPVSRRASSAEGERLFVTIPSSYRQSRQVMINDETIRIDALQERVRQRMEGATDKQVYLRGDENVVYQDLYDVIDRLRAAGVQAIGLVAREPERR
jgi:biopolymer transport protein ExbD